jgi:hypothetical protein
MTSGLTVIGKRGRHKDGAWKAFKAVMQILPSNDVLNCLISFSRLMWNWHVMLSPCRDE